MRVDRMSRSPQIILSGLGLILIATAFLVGCEKNQPARIFGPAADPVMIGQWKGTVSASLTSQGDTLQNAPVKARYTFTDTSFTYKFVDDFNATIPPYIGGGSYERNENIVDLQDTTTYNQWTDRSRTPIPGEHYELTLTATKMTLLWVHDYGSGQVRGQRIELTRY